MMKHDARGFGSVELVILLLVTVVVILIGFYDYKVHHVGTAKTSNSSSGQFSNWESFTSNKEDFSFEYPPTWKIRSDDGNSVTLSNFDMGLNNAKDSSFAPPVSGIRFTAQLLQRPIDDNYSLPTTVAKDTIGVPTNNIVATTRLPNVKISGYDAIVFSEGAEPPDVSGFVLSYNVILAKQIYTFGFTVSNSSKLSVYQRTIDHLVSKIYIKS